LSPFALMNDDDNFSLLVSMTFSDTEGISFPDETDFLTLIVLTGHVEYIKRREITRFFQNTISHSNHSALQRVWKSFPFLTLAPLSQLSLS
jgi:hypothetical protein